MKKLIFIVLINLSFSQLSLELISSGFDKPIYVTTEPNNNNKLYVVEQEGSIWTIDLLNDSLEVLVLDLTDRVHKPLFPGDERGLLGLAFDPEYLSNSFIYVNYNDKENNTIVSKIKLNEKIDFEENILLKFKQPYSNHNGGHLDFGPDGYLYISIGDGGSSGDPESRAQDTTNYFGTILRTLPKSNDSLNFNKEIYAYGLRNVWRFSFDKITGDMYLGDVGQNSWEEINFIPAGSKEKINFGWNYMEASSCFREETECFGLKDNFEYPIFEYPNDAKYARTLFGLKQKNIHNIHGCSVTGGYVYRGKNIPKLYGKYIFGDYCTGKVWSFRYENDEVIDFKDHTLELLGSINKKSFYLSSFGESDDGELFLIDYDGEIYKLKGKNR